MQAHTHTHTHLCKHSIHTAYYTHSAHANTQYTLLIKRSPHHANTQYTLLIKHPPHHANTQYTLIIIIHTLHHATLSTHSLYKHCTMQTLNTHSLSHNTLHHANIQYTLCITHTHTHCTLQTHTCLPQNCVLRNKNHQNPEHRIIFRNTSANVSPHLWNKSSYQILQENRRAIHCAPPLLIPRSWERCRSRSTVRQFNHFTTVLWTSQFTQVSTSSSMVIKGHFSWYVFLNVWKHLLFAGDGFAGARSIDSAMLSIPNIFTNGALISKIYSACSFVDAMFSWGNFGEIFCCFMSFAHAQSTSKANLHISIFRTCKTRPKVALVSSGTKASATLREGQKGCVCLLLLFHKWQNLELLRGYLYFWKALLILMIFPNKYGRAVTIGMYAKVKTNVT